MNKKLSLALLLCIPTAYGMQSAQNTYDIMKHVFAYTMWLDSESLDTDQKPQPNTRTINTGSSTIHMMEYVSLPKKNKYTHNKKGLWHTIKRNHHLQYVSKNFKSIFWDYFKTRTLFTLEEKDESIATLLRLWNQGNFHETYLTFSPMPPIADIAIQLGANLYPVLRGSIITTRNCNPNFVRVIIDSENNNVINESSNYGYTSLCDAIAHDNKNSHLKIVKLLLMHPNIQVNPLDKQRCSLFWATYYCKIEIVKLLLAHPDINVNAIDSYGSSKETALFAAVRASWPDISEFRSIVTLLLNAGIDSTIKNTEGETALDVARSHAYTADRAEVLELVLAMRK